MMTIVLLVVLAIVLFGLFNDCMSNTGCRNEASPVGWILFGFFALIFIYCIIMFVASPAKPIT